VQPLLPDPVVISFRDRLMADRHPLKLKVLVRPQVSNLITPGSSSGRIAISEIVHNGSNPFPGSIYEINILK
jgi:hypothetical protein